MIKIAGLEDSNRPRPRSEGYVPYFWDEVTWRGGEPPLPSPEKFAEYSNLDKIADSDVQRLFDSIVRGSEDERKQAEQTISEILRTHLFVTSVTQQILPQQPVTPDDPIVRRGENDSLFVEVPRQLKKSEFSRLPAYGSSVGAAGQGHIYVNSRWVKGYFWTLRTNTIKKSPIEMAAWGNTMFQELLSNIVQESMAIALDKSFFSGLAEIVDNAISNNLIQSDQVFKYEANPDNILLPNNYSWVIKRFSDNLVPLGFFVVKNTTWLDVLNWGRSTTGDPMWGEILVNGVIFDHVFNIPVVTTNSPVVPPGVIIGVSTPKYLGGYYTMQPTRFHSVYDEREPGWMFYADQILANVFHNPLSIVVFSRNSDIQNWTQFKNYIDNV